MDGMNLTDMLRDGSVSNHTWLDDIETFEPTGKDWNKKDDLELEFGYGDIEPKYNEEILKEAKEDPSTAIVVAARFLMNQGHMGRQLVKRLFQQFDRQSIKAAVSKLKPLLDEEGITGCVALDCRDLKDCREVKKVVASSENKRFLKFVLMHTRCADCSFLGKTAINTESEMKTASIDGFFADEGPKKEFRPFCVRLGRPLLSGQQDLHDDEMDETLVDLVTTGKLTEEEAKVVRSLRNKNAYEKVRQAFRLIHKKQFEVKPVVQQVDSSKFHIKSEMSVDLDAPRKKKEEVKVALSDADMESQLKDVDKLPAKQESGFDSFEGAPQVADENITFGSQEDLDFEDFEPGTIPNEEMNETAKTSKYLDIEPHVFVEKEFEGSDQLRLEEKKAKQKEVDVDITSSFDFE